MRFGQLLTWIALVVALGACNRANPNLGELCESDEECGEDAICSERWSPSLTPQCTAVCLEPGRCDEVFGEGECAQECYLPCEQDSDCPTGTGCGFGQCRPRCDADADCAGACAGGFCEP